MGKGKKYNHRICFLCGREIEGEAITDEHVFSDSFLQDFDLKLETMNFGSTRPIKYSQVKVPAHKKCNNEGGARFEAYMRNILRTMSENEDVMQSIAFTRDDDVTNAIREVLVHWLAKIFYGLIYWEVGMKNHPRPDKQNGLYVHLDDFVLKKIQASVVDEQKFNIPSTLFWFKVPCHEDGTKFDFASHHELKSFFIRFGPNLLVSCLGDCNLVSEWFGQEQFRNSQSFIDTARSELDLTYLAVVAEIWAVRSVMPVSPQIAVNDDSVVDISRIVAAERPDIDVDAVRDSADSILQWLCER